MSLIRWKDFVRQRAVLADIFYCLKTLCRLGARVTPRPKVAGFCAAQWPDFIPPLTWEEVEWIFDIPEVTWDLTTIKMHIPEVTMRMKRTRGSGGAEPPLEPPSRGARPDPDQRLRKTHAKRATSRLASLEPDAVQGVYSTQP